MSDHDDDYLWDKSGKPDADLAKLEASLSRLKHKPRAFAAPAAVPIRRREVVVAFRARVALAASVLLIAGAALYFSRLPAMVDAGLQCNVSSIEGTSRAGAAVVAPGGSPVPLTPGEDVVTGESRARIELANGIGNVDVDPGTSVRLEELEDHTQRLSLAEGSISARVYAVPRLFIVDTPHARAVDLGCAYTLAVVSSGGAHLAVTSGRVELEDRGRRSVVPAGASCDTREGFGPGTPYWNDSTPAFRAALARVDFEIGGSSAMADVLRESRATDALTLVHLLPRTGPSDLPALFDRLAKISPPPEGVTRASVISRQPWAQDAWRDAVLGGGDRPEWGKFSPKQFAPK